MKKILIVVLVMMFAFNAAAIASTNKPLQNLGKGLDNVLYGKLEVPDNINETGSKGSPVSADCTDATKDDVGRGIARTVRGVWQILTFWYPEEG